MAIISNSEEAPRPNSKRFGREAVMQYLFSCEVKGEFPSAETFSNCYELICNEDQLEENRFTRKAKEFAVELYTQVELNRERIDALLVPRCEEGWGWDRISAVDRNIMRVAVAEMLCFDSIPDVVSINEAVEIGRDFSGSASGSFINGVLNRIMRELPPPEKRKE